MMLEQRSGAVPALPPRRLRATKRPFLLAEVNQVAVCLAVAFLLPFGGGRQPCALRRGFSSSGKLKQHFTTRSAP